MSPLTSKYPRGISPSFRKRANEAAFWEAWVGTVLSRSGLFTVHRPFLADGGDQHGLSWDLDVGSEQATIRVECKSMNKDFTSVKDLPYKTMLVCSDNSWRRKWGDVSETARDFLFISRESGSILWLPIGSPTTVRTITDPERNETFASRETEVKNIKDLWGFVEYAKQKVGLR